MVIRDSVLGAAVAEAPWTEMSGFPWQEARFAEYRNTGPGATVNENRPQLDPAQARNFTRETYLSGWQPWRDCQR